jgi:hypothetical protein
LSCLVLHQPPIKRERRENRKFRNSSLKEKVPDSYPQILQVDPDGTNHGAAVTIGAKIDAFLEVLDLAFPKRAAGCQCLDGGELFRRENIDVWDPLKSDGHRTTGSAHGTMGASVQLHQLDHGKTLPHPALGETPGMNESFKPASDSTGKTPLHFSPPAALIKRTRGLTRMWNILLKGR